MMRFVSLPFGKRRVTLAELDGSPWLVGDDVLLAFGVRSERRPGLLARLAEHDRRTVPGGEGARDMTLVSPDGLRRLAELSRHPDAEGFLEWTERVALPALRGEGILAERVAAQREARAAAERKAERRVKREAKAGRRVLVKVRGNRLVYAKEPPRKAVRGDAPSI